MKKVENSMLGLLGPFTKIAAAMSREWKVRVVADGMKCCTDGDVVYIPFTADYLPADKRQALNGLLDHEVAHVAEERVHREAGRPTPVSVIKAESNPTLRLLFNVFEDIRIETKYAARYPGVAQNLSAANQNSVEVFRKRHGDGNFWHSIGCALIMAARGLPTDWLSAKWRPYFELCHEELAASTRTEWGSDSMALAQSVYEKLREAAESAKKEKAKKPKGEKSEPGDEPGEYAEGADDVDSEASETDVMDAPKREATEAAKKDATSHGRYVPNAGTRKLDRWRKPAGDISAYNVAKEEVRSQIGALRARQLAYLKTLTRSRLVGDLDEGTIDATALASVRSGRRNVYCDVKRARDLDTAIEVLIDLSGSMGDGDHTSSCAYYAKRTAIALAESWEPLGVAHEFIGFHNKSYSGHGRGAGDGTVSRAPFEFLVFKEFGEKLAPCRARFSAIRGYEDNADGEAVWEAALRLAKRPERRKILVVISDGVPCHAGCDRDLLNSHLKEVVKRITSAGIEVIGIGAGTDAPRSFYNKSTGATNIVVNKLDTLASTVFVALRERLMEVGRVR